jgi:hypothetical protein
LSPQRVAGFNRDADDRSRDVRTLPGENYLLADGGCANIDIAQLFNDVARGCMDDLAAVAAGLRAISP